MNESLTVSRPAQNTSQPLVFDSPPALPAQISTTELAATEGGPAQNHARGLSSRAALLAGAIGGALFGAAIFTAKTAQRGLKIAGSAIAGGIIGNVISSLPWAKKQQQAEPVVQNHPVTRPNLPNLPPPQPAPHPAIPGNSVDASETVGRVEAPSQEATLSV